MAYPPVIPPNTRANNTPELDNHPADHNALANALTDIVAKINSIGWGLMAVPAYKTATQTIGTSATDVSGLSLNVTLRADRAYATFVHIPQWSQSGGSFVQTYITDGANTALARYVVNGPAGSTIWGTDFCYVERAPAAGAAVRKVRASVATGTVDCTVTATDKASIFMVDIGPA